MKNKVFLFIICLFLFPNPVTAALPYIETIVAAPGHHHEKREFLSIIGIFCTTIGNLLAPILGPIAAIILGIKALKQDQPHKVLAWIDIILGSALTIGVIVYFITHPAFAT